MSKTGTRPAGGHSSAVDPRFDQRLRKLYNRNQQVVVESDNFAVLERAAQKGDLLIVEKLCEPFATVNPSAFSSSSKSPGIPSVACRLSILHGACFAGHDKIVRRLLELPLWKQVINGADKLGRTALHVAATSPNDSARTTCVDVLLEFGADLSLKSVKGDTPLMDAVKSNVLGFSLALMSSHIDDTDDVGDTALHVASKLGREDILDLLIEHGASIDVANVFLNTPLHLAARAGASECIELLLDHSADVRVIDGDGRSPAAVALESNHPALASRLSHAQRNRLESVPIQVWPSTAVSEWFRLIDVDTPAELGGNTSSLTKMSPTGSEITSMVEMRDEKDVIEWLMRDVGISSYQKAIKVCRLVRGLARGIRIRNAAPPADSSNANGLSSTSSGSSLVFIQENELVLKERIGYGHFADVYRAEWNATDVAVKIIRRNSYAGSFDLFSSEATTLSKLRHPNVLMLLGVSKRSDGRPCIVTELMSGGTLREWLNEDAPFLKRTKAMQIRILFDIAKGLAYLHNSKPPFLHRDLTSSNILLDSTLRAKVSDFGLSLNADAQDSNTNGSDAGDNSSRPKDAFGQFMWMSPEVLTGGAYTEAADVYSFGVVAWEVLTNKQVTSWVPEFADETTRNEMPLVSAAKLWRSAIVGGIRPNCDDLGPGWREFLSSCWHDSPMSRPTMVQVLLTLREVSERSADVPISYPENRGDVQNAKWTSQTSGNAGFKFGYVE